MKRVLLSALVLTLAVAVVPSALHAKDFEHKDAKVTLWIPDDWTIEAEEELLTATDKAETIGLIFWVVDADAIETVMKELEKELGKVIKDAEPTGEPTETKVNGMDAMFIDGVGKVEGEKVAWSLGLVVTPAGKVLFTLGMADPEQLSKHEATLEKIMKGLKPMK